MNIEINHLKDEIYALRMQLEDLNKIVLEPRKFQYFNIQYHLEYIEPIDLKKLLADIIEEIPIIQIHRCYTILKQIEDKSYFNPTLGIRKFDIDITFYLQLYNKIVINQLESYFDKKLGTVNIIPYQNKKDFNEELRTSYKSISHYFESSMGEIKLLPIPKLTSNSLLL